MKEDDDVLTFFIGLFVGGIVPPQAKGYVFLRDIASNTCFLVRKNDTNSTACYCLRVVRF